jgi:hypothetical protein
MQPLRQVRRGGLRLFFSLSPIILGSGGAGFEKYDVNQLRIDAIDSAVRSPWPIFGARAHNPLIRDLRGSVKSSRAHHFFNVKL